MALLQDTLRAILIGIGATAVMDLWVLFIRVLGMPALDYALVGRWAGHLLRGRWAHAAIGKAEPIPGERALGWLIHYAVGVAFAVLLVALQGAAWAASPTPLPAIAVGMFTVLVPLLIMQPAMGAGVASSKTPTPLKNCLRSLTNHMVFGLGLYWSAALIAALASVA